MKNIYLGTLFAGTLLASQANNITVSKNHIVKLPENINNIWSYSNYNLITTNDKIYYQLNKVGEALPLNITFDTASPADTAPTAFWNIATLQTPIVSKLNNDYKIVTLVLIIGIDSNKNGHIYKYTPTSTVESEFFSGGGKISTISDSVDSSINRTNIASFTKSNFNNYDGYSFNLYKASGNTVKSLFIYQNNIDGSLNTSDVDVPDQSDFSDVNTTETEKNASIMGDTFKSLWIKHNFLSSDPITYTQSGDYFSKPYASFPISAYPTINFSTLLRGTDKTLDIKKTVLNFKYNDSKFLSGLVSGDSVYFWGINPELQYEFDFSYSNQMAIFSQLFSGIAQTSTENIYSIKDSINDVFLTTTETKAADFWGWKSFTGIRQIMHTDEKHYAISENNKILITDYKGNIVSSVNVDNPTNLITDENGNITAVTDNGILNLNQNDFSNKNNSFDFKWIIIASISLVGVVIIFSFVHLIRKNKKLKNNIK